MNVDIKAHIKMVQHPNPTRRTYHVVRDVSTEQLYGFGQDNLLFSSRDKNPGTVAKALAKALETIPGVVDGHLSQYEISVGIGEAFDWADIAPFVVGAIIQHVYPEVDGKTIEISTNVGHSYRVNKGGMWSDMDDGHRVEYDDVTKRFKVPVDLGKGRPALDVEFLFSHQAQDKAKNQAVEQASDANDAKKH